MTEQTQTLSLDTIELTTLLLTKDPVSVIAYYVDVISGELDKNLDMTTTGKTITLLYQVISGQPQGANITEQISISEHRYRAIFKLLQVYSDELTDMFNQVAFEERIMATFKTIHAVTARA